MRIRIVSRDRLNNSHINDLREIFESNSWPEASNVCNALSGLQSTEFLVTAYHNDKLIGFARAVGDTFWSATIDAVCLHKDYQGKGIGSRMVRHLLTFFKDCTYISVSPNDSEAVSFYEGLDFKQVRTGTLLQIDRGE